MPYKWQHPSHGSVFLTLHIISSVFVTSLFPLLYSALQKGFRKSEDLKSDLLSSVLPYSFCHEIGKEFQKCSLLLNLHAGNPKGRICRFEHFLAFLSPFAGKGFAQLGSLMLLEHSEFRNQQKKNSINKTH